jgi:hypothetical protein
MDAQSMAIMAAASRDFSTPGVVRELRAENLRLQAENLRLQAYVERALAEIVAVADHRDEEMQRLRDAHADEIDRWNAHVDEIERFHARARSVAQYAYDDVRFAAQDNAIARGRGGRRGGRR